MKKTILLFLLALALPGNLISKPSNHYGNKNNTTKNLQNDQRRQRKATLTKNQKIIIAIAGLLGIGCLVAYIIGSSIYEDLPPSFNYICLPLIITSFFIIIAVLASSPYQDSFQEPFRSEQPHREEDRQDRQTQEQEDEQNQEEQEDRQEQGELCTICQDNITNDACKTPCNHHFHKQCITQWLQNDNTCPNCRSPLSPQDLQTEQEQAPPQEQTRNIVTLTPARIQQLRQINGFVDFRNYTNQQHIMGAACWNWALTACKQGTIVRPSYLFTCLEKRNRNNPIHTYFPIHPHHGLAWYQQNARHIQALKDELVRNNWSRASVLNVREKAIKLMIEANGLQVAPGQQSTYYLYVYYEKDDKPDWTHWGIEVAGVKVEKLTGKELSMSPAFYSQKVVKIPITGLTPLHKQHIDAMLDTLRNP